MPAPRGGWWAATFAETSSPGWRSGTAPTPSFVLPSFIMEKTGVIFNGNGTKGSLVRSLIYRNAGEAGVLSTQGAAPTISYNRIFEHAINVAFEGPSTGGHLLSNAIFGGGQTGVAMFRGAEPLVEGNFIYGSGQVIYSHPRPFCPRPFCASPCPSLGKAIPFFFRLECPFALPLLVPLLTPCILMDLSKPNLIYPPF